MITDERAEKALRYLVETDEPCARAKANMIGSDERRKTVRALELLKNTGTVAEREALALTSEAYEQAIEAHENAVADYELLRNKRMTESLVIEMYRTTSANQRKGNI